jgi:hypothetical protein
MARKNGTDNKPKQPAFVQELLTKGTTTITALSRDEFAPMLRDIPKDVKYAAGVVARDCEAGVYLLRLDLV